MSVFILFKKLIYLNCSNHDATVGGNTCQRPPPFPQLLHLKVYLIS